MKLPPRTGTVQKLSGKRRKPYLAKRFVGWRIDDEKRKSYPVYRSIGTFAKKSEAINALMKDALSPEEKATTITLSEVYTAWSEKKYTEIKPPTIRAYRSAWNYLSILGNRPISQLRTSDYETAVDVGNAPRTMRVTIQNLLNALYRYAIAHEYCDKDISALTDFHGSSETKIKRRVFTPQEVADLFTSDNVKDQMILVAIYTGLRPVELRSLRRDEIDGEFLRIRGSKTKNGVFRDIWIHPDISTLIALNAAKSAKFGKPEVFLSSTHKPYDEQVFYDWVRKKNHTPHDTRHSFVTYAKRSGMDQLAVKRIVGHASGRDVTADIYTHTDDDFIKAEMQKFRIA